MPGTKSRTKRRKKRWAHGPSANPSTGTKYHGPIVSSPRNTPILSAIASPLTSPALSTPTTPTTTMSTTASRKKLSMSPHVSICGSSSKSECEIDECELEEQGCRIFELGGLMSVFQSLGCGECGEKGLVYREDFTKRQGLYTAPYLLCERCSYQVAIPFSSVGDTKVLTVNRKAVFANKCAGGSAASLQMLFSMLDMPGPVSKNVYTTHLQQIEIHAKLQADDSMTRAREEVRTLYGSENDGDIVDVLVSCDGTWQRRGFSSLFGAAFVIAHETGKVIDYVVKSKFCKACKHWEKQDRTSEAYVAWKEAYTSVCDANFSGSAGSMEPQGTLEMFGSSLSHGLRYKWLISDGDSKTHALLLREQPYGKDHLVQKISDAIAAPTLQ